MVNAQLKGWQVVVMRPKHLAEPLLSAIKEMGGSPISLPTLTITPIPASMHVAKWTAQIQAADWIVVSSQNAVHFAPEEVLKALQTSPAKVVTMGPATTEALMTKGVSVFFTPKEGTDSEKLLAEPFFQENDVANQKIILLAGEGGRTLLHDTLKVRGATVNWVKVYRQEQPPLALSEVLQDWSSSQGSFCFIAMSQNSLTNFLENVPVKHRNWLRMQAFLVVSERIAEVARKWEIQHIYIAKGAQKQQLCATLLHVAQFCHTMT